MLANRVTKTLSGLSAAAMLCLAALFASTAVADQVTDAIAERIAPVGSLCKSGDDCAAAPVAAAPAGPRSGEDIYNASCTTCHAIGVSGAPRFGNADDWAPRIAQGMDTLFDHAWNGLNAMPAKGLCMDCSEDDIKAAIQHMVDASQ
ncbi:c-type cytochrome [Halioxenophilus aromaticivorans]|uniref:Cytochrome c5 family protein n=1 Tax=Halioxenophilus aromaticivorans TaxID=1306992 RepID=A0AAV3U627_9ALTE